MSEKYGVLKRTADRFRVIAGRIYCHFNRGDGWGEGFGNTLNGDAAQDRLDRWEFETGRPFTAYAREAEKGRRLIAKHLSERD